MEKQQSSLSYSPYVSLISSETISKWSPIVPVLALFFAWVLIGDVPTSVQWVGIAIVLAGLAIAQAKFKRHAPEDSDATLGNAKPLTGA